MKIILRLVVILAIYIMIDTKLNLKHRGISYSRRLKLIKDLITFNPFEPMSKTYRFKSLLSSVMGNSTSNATSGSAPAAGGNLGYNGKYHDVVGKPANESIAITTSPWEVTMCNQVLLIKAESLKDLTINKDFMEREPAYFTMNAYLINKLVSANLTTLRESIPINHLKIEPYILQGSKSCIVFQDSLSSRKFSLCMSTSLEAQQILKALNTFEKCRLGADLKPFDKLQVDLLLKSTCYDIPEKRTEDPSNQRGFGSDIGGMNQPKVNTTAVKHLLKSTFESAGV